MEINVQPYIDQLNQLSDYMGYRIRSLYLNQWCIYRIIMPDELEEKGGLFTPDPPKKWMITDMEFTTERWHQHPMRGWGTKPDERMHMIGKDIEVWMLHKNEKILSFEQWSLKN